MSEYPNYTLTQLAKLILQFDHQEGLSPASLENLKEFAKSALENASQQGVQRIGYQTAIIPCPHCGVNVTIYSDSFIANR